MRLRLLLVVPLLLAGCGTRAHVTATPSLSPSPTPTTTPTLVPSATTSPSASPSATASSTATPTAPPGPAEAVTTRTGVSTMTLGLDHASAPTATVLRLRIQVSSDSGWWNGFSVRYGDGQRFDEPGVAVSCPSPAAGGHQPSAAPSSGVRDLQLSYRVPGRYDLDVQAVTDSPCAPGPREELHAQLHVLVTPGPRLTNGPQLPSIGSITGSPVAGGTRLEAFDLKDPDGVVSQVTWQFGDGRLESDHAPDRCTDPGTRWPQDSSEPYREVTHRYPHHGTYQVRLTIISTGCRGGDGQRATRVASVRV